jgi:acyl-CoA reductase-like NAD-dependent aldehyde dehydrogenase/nicotinamidase-related amidase
VKSALLLVDLQEDYLGSPALTPTRGEVIAQVASLLARCRAARVPVFHVYTTVRRDRDERMPHWRQVDRWMCVEGTPGHAPPPELRPADGEKVVHKTHFSAFDDESLLLRLRARGIDEVWLAGVYTHACIRTTAIDAYRLGFAVTVAADAVASDQPLHADETRRYLTARAMEFVPAGRLLRPATRAPSRPADTALLPAAALGGDETIGDPSRESLVHEAPAERGRVLWRVPIADAKDVAVAVERAHAAARAWAATSAPARLDVATRLARSLEAHRPPLARRMAIEIGKPIGDAGFEVDFARALIHAATRRAAAILAQPEAQPSALGWERRRPLGTVAVITPWNVPLAVPLGKIVPALLYGNAVVWKPAPAGSGIALELLRLLGEAGVPPGVVTLVCGDHATAERLLEHEAVAAVSVTGSSALGTCAQAICAARRIPLQAELGGNNAAIVWSDADVADAAVKLAAGAFGSAGQRCTANRRLIVAADRADELVDRFLAASGDLPWGDPIDPGTRIGPLVSAAACARVAGVVERACAAGAEVRSAPAHIALEASLADAGAYHPLRVVRCDDPRAEIVREETFGPVAVVQVVRSWDEALERLNGVSQGLVAALFSNDAERRRSFLENAKAGILKIGSATAGVGAEVAFSGWKASGIGPAEHGSGDPEFYTRVQSVYVENPAPEND